MKWLQTSSASTKRRARLYLAPFAALGGLVLVVVLIRRLGLARIVDQAQALGPLVPILLVLTGFRYVLQAAGWRLAMPAGDRLTWFQSLRAVVTGEAVGYVGGGTFTREPVKAFSVRRQMPAARALSAALPERLGSIVASIALIALAVVLMTLRVARAPWPAAAAVALAVIAILIRSGHRRGLSGRHAHGAREVSSARDARGAHGTFAQPMAVARELWHARRGALVAIATVAAAQEVVNVFEAYLLLTWLGAGPTLVTTIAYEGATRAMNGVGTFVPGRLGVSEATGTFAAGVLGLSGSYGLSVALARRARSVLWAVAGLTLLAYGASRDLAGRAASARRGATFAPTARLRDTSPVTAAEA